MDIPFNKPFIVGKELHYIAQAVHNSQLAGDGPFTKRCHEWLEKQTGSPKALLTHSCTAALEMAALLCDVGPGDEVIMPSFTFVSTANAFALRGATPVFVDIRPDTLNIDEKKIADAVTERTKAIVPVHYAGIGCEMDEIMNLAQSHGLYVIEDAAQGLLSSYRDKPLGSIGHLGCLSFHETKNIICGEGGALLVNDESLIERAEIIREKGTDRSSFFRGEVDKYTWREVGSSFLPGELTAAFLYAQFEEAEKIINWRRQAFSSYLKLLEPLAESGICRLPFTDDAHPSNGHIMYLITRSLEERTALIAHLGERGIHAVFHYIPLHQSEAGKRLGRAHGELGHTEALSESLLRLPLFFGITEEEIEQVAGSVLEFYELS